MLDLSIDLADRLLPAFHTKTGIPYGTVNLHTGVPKGETKISSTAGAGSLFIEFHILSALTGDTKYSLAAYRALEALYDRRSPLDLVGKHINIESGQWQETLSGVGSNSDSFYEYLLKSYALLNNPLLYKHYMRTYKAIKKYILHDDKWFSEVDMFNGKHQRNRVENLDAFWPGLEVLMGNFHSSASQMRALYSIWIDLGFLPEEIDLVTWRNGKGPSNPLYPLRPELVESTYYQYRATADRTWLHAGQIILDSIQNYTRTGCGYASVANIGSMELSDTMPSFFLSETAKYLYLLFEENNFLHHRPIIFSTEAHPFDRDEVIMQRPCATASFGPGAPIMLQSELVIPSHMDENMCTRKTKPKKSTTNTGSNKQHNSENREDVAAENGEEQGEDVGKNHGEEEEEEGKIIPDDANIFKSWFRKTLFAKKFLTDFTSFSSSSSSTTTDRGGMDNNSSSNKKHSLYSSNIQGKIAIAYRGNCLFEDKALLAQEDGAIGLIVRNKEVRIYSDYYCYSFFLTFSNCRIHSSLWLVGMS